MKPARVHQLWMLRRSRGLSRRQLAELAKVSTADIERWELYSVPPARDAQRRIMSVLQEAQEEEEIDDVANGGRHLAGGN